MCRGRIAKVLNAAGYYTEPLYLTANLSQVYADADPRTYELSSCLYLIVPTDTSFGLTSDQGFTLGSFGQFGYAALPVNLVMAGYDQLLRIPGSTLPTRTRQFVQGCGNPTFSPDGTDRLASSDPMPPACNKVGATSCAGGGTDAAAPLTVSVPATGAVTLTVAAGVVSMSVRRQRQRRA